MNQIFREEKGFTLVELAIVLIIVGLLLGLGAGMIGPLTKRVKLTESREIVNAAVDSVMGYASINNRVPDLSASPSATSFWTNVRTQNDAWVRQLVYVFDNNLTTSICNRTSTNVTARICNDAACGTFSTINNVAFLVASAGDNANNQTYASQAIAAATTINTYIVGIAVDNYAGDFTRATDEYDDIIKWMTLSELKTKIGCTRYDLCTGGITVNNQSGNLYYRLNGGACTLWNNGTNITLTTTNSYQLFTDVVCATACTPQSNMNYTQQKDVDVNNNCQTRINPGCQMLDQ